MVHGPVPGIRDMEDIPPLGLAGDFYQRSWENYAMAMS